MPELRRALTWLWRAWASTPLIVGFGSLLIGYLRSGAAPELPALRDLIEVTVGLGCSAMVALPLVIGACYLDKPKPAITSAAASRHWLVWALLALVLPVGFCMSLEYLFGWLGVEIRLSTMSIFERS